MRPSPHHLALTGLAALCFSTPALALYKVVGPDGRITYTDQAPAANAAPVKGSSGARDDQVGASLPYELRQTVARYPVQIYVREECAPCQMGRSLLQQRGVPYTERTVNTPADAEAFQRLEGTTTLPVLRVGGQQIKGFAAADWNSYLDAAGYPKQSTLPSGYRNPAPQPMVARETLPTKPRTGGEAASAAEAAPAGGARVVPTDTRSPTPGPGTGGIRF